MGGSKGESQTTIQQPLTRQQYDPTGYAAREWLFPKLKTKYDTGLSDEEMSYYRGLGTKDIETAAGANMNVLRENLARMGIGPGDGASAESVAELLRNKLIARSALESDLIGKDIGMKQQNYANLASLISDTGPIGSAGSTTTTQGGGGSTAKNVIGGALGGAIGGGTAFGLPGAISGAVLGGLGGLF